MVARVAAGAAAVALAFGLPVLVVVLAVVDDRWRPFVGTLITLFVAVPLVAWFVTRTHLRADSDAEPPSD